VFEVLRLPFGFAQGRSGFRLRARTPAKRLKLATRGATALPHPSLGSVGQAGRDSNRVGHGSA